MILLLSLTATSKPPWLRRDESSVLALQAPSQLWLELISQLTHVETMTLALRCLYCGLSMCFSRIRRVLVKINPYIRTISDTKLLSGKFASLHPFYRLGNRALRDILATPVGADRIQETGLPVLQYFTRRLVDQVRVESRPIPSTYIRMLKVGHALGYN